MAKGGGTRGAKRTSLGPGETTAFFAAHPHLVSSGIFQEIIRGGDGHILVCAAYFDRHAEPLALYTGRKLRQLQPDDSVTCDGISEDLPELADKTISLLRRIRFRGLVAVGWAQERSTGQFYFIEINQRAYYHNALFQACGVDLPWITYPDAVEHPMLRCELRPRQRYGLRWIDLARDGQLATALSAADRAVGRLAGEGRRLPNPHLLTRPFVRREAVLSSRIEGTQATLGELLAAEAKTAVERSPADLRDVGNYVVALEYGVERMRTPPLSLRLVRELHKKLVRGVPARRRGNRP